MMAYTGYIEVSLTDDEMAALYSNMSDNRFGCLENQYLVVAGSQGEVVDRLRWTGTEFKKAAYHTIQNQYLGRIRPRNLQQELAFDLLQNKDIPVKLLTGCYGSGESCLTL